MSATCDQCSESAFGGVTLCPLHAEAEAMRGALRRVLALTEGQVYFTGWHAEARVILARIDGDTPDA